ncbi:MAG: transposase [Chroococcidiopsidaceae cyanobacterium CP_BM_ER_R8_30]|nr:transposase [Chroococcidiopsidaceae cyanobacterium CP_BM_ER_R8_30]
MLLGFTTKLKLNNQQRTVMAQHAGYRRWLWNRALSWWSIAYKEGLKPTANKLKKFYTKHVKPSYPWQSQLSSKVYQYCFQDLGNAFENFFKGASYPKFKKRGVNDSFTIDNSGKSIALKGVKTKLPFIGWVSTYEPLPECQVKKVTISYRAGDWYISFAYEQNRTGPPKAKTSVGVDLGIKALATLSNGKVFANLHVYRLAERKLKRLQRSLSRKKKGSANRLKARFKVALAHRRVADIRKDYLHKLTSYLAKNFETVVIEDLSVSSMMANHKLAKAIGDLGMYEFRRQLEYKCQLYGTELVIADRWFPSSKLCFGCGHVKDMPLSERVYNCDKCGLVLDRDLNAAMNLSNWGRLAPGCLSDGVPPTVPVEAGSKPQCPDMSGVVSVL